MGLLSVSLTFVGYVLVYAAVANHGRFALAPWAGVTTDAYETQASAQQQTAPPSSAPPPRKRGSSSSPVPPITQGGH